MTIEWIEKYMLEAEHMITENRVDEGLALLNELLYDEPGYASLHNHLGWAYMYYTPDQIRASLHFGMAMKFADEFAPPYQHMTVLHIRKQEYDEAIAVAEKGLKTKLCNRVALLEQMAIAYELKKEYTRAIKTYKEALMSTAGHETNALAAGIKRCARKRLRVLFTF